MTIHEASVAWMITKDHLPDEDAPLGTNLNAVGLAGPRDATEGELAALARGEGTKFKMFDDDGELYYEGLFLGDATSEGAFEPLDGFGRPNAGCERIDYHVGHNKYETL